MKRPWAIGFLSIGVLILITSGMLSLFMKAHFPIDGPCGLIAFATFANSCNISISVDQLRDTAGDCPTNTLLGIKQLAERFGFECEAKSCTFSELCKVLTTSNGAIMHCNSNHFVLARRRDDRSIVVHDAGLPVVYDEGKFCAQYQWDNACLFLKRDHTTARRIPNGINFDTSEIELGVIILGESRSFRFILRNNANMPQRIQRVSSTCGCTTLRDYSGLMLMPNETLGIEGKLLAAASVPGNGATRKSIIVQVEGSQAPLLAHLSYKTVLPIEIEEESLRFFISPFDPDSFSGAITLRNNTNEEVRIQNNEDKLHRIAIVQSSPIALKPKQTHRVEFKLSSNRIPLGNFTANLSTSYKSFPAINLPVLVRYLNGSISVSRTELLLLNEEEKSLEVIGRGCQLKLRSLKYSDGIAIQTRENDCYRIPLVAAQKPDAYRVFGSGELLIELEIIRTTEGPREVTHNTLLIPVTLGRF